MNISGYLRDIGSTNEPDIELMKKNIGVYLAYVVCFTLSLYEICCFFLSRHLVYFSSYISTISTLAKFFNSSLKLIDSKQRLFNANNAFEESLPSSPSYSNGLTPLRSFTSMISIIAICILTF